MLVSVLLNAIIFIFPFLCYCIYLMYSNVFEKEKSIFLDLTIITSAYLCIRFCFDINSVVTYIIVLLMFAIYKKRIIAVAVLLFCTFYIFNVHSIFNVNIIFVCISIAAVYSIAIYLFGKMEAMIKLHQSLHQISKEKTLYDSLFKITHEIKNPLAVCKGYIDMFDANDVKKSGKYIGIIGEEIERTLLILNDFSDISKINVELTNVNITELLYDVCDEYRFIINNTKFNTNILGNDVFIYGDYSRLKQVFINLIKNANESINKNGIITIKTYIKGNNYVISIKDNGEGMDKDTLRKIGSAFYTTKKNGTGLGVCLSKEIIQRHDGSIKYYSKKDVGTNVVVRLPIKKPSID